VKLWLVAKSWGDRLDVVSYDPVCAGVLID
jgi:hypothetical protein